MRRTNNERTETLVPNRCPEYVGRDGAPRALRAVVPFLHRRASAALVSVRLWSSARRGRLAGPDHAVRPSSVLLCHATTLDGRWSALPYPAGACVGHSLLPVSHPLHAGT